MVDTSFYWVKNWLHSDGKTNSGGYILWVEENEAQEIFYNPMACKISENILDLPSLFHHPMLFFPDKNKTQQTLNELYINSIFWKDITIQGNSFLKWQTES